MLLKQDVLQAVINEIEETGDWASLAAALGQYGINPLVATNREILDFTDQVSECEEITACIYKEGEQPVFRQDKKFIKPFIASALRKNDLEKSEALFSLLFDVSADHEQSF
ncbi:hypothetical protein [Corynebacterium pelargi]|uniref:Uncharacterized protein n=1 Tax=Corynebacterium pelargi TaxID=1471400 RepID=A0A410WAJ1_9CORY|nr:hypothetical protein [Corynebacterium pelargi]QAU52981.1 hypothetical protein CPELA_08630 [Corynebacterium pelargi]